MYVTLYIVYQKEKEKNIVKNYTIKKIQSKLEKSIEQSNEIEKLCNAK